VLDAAKRVPTESLAGEHNVRSVCVFCGSSSGRREAYATAAREIGAELVRRGLTLVYGGGDVGLMGTLADVMLESGGLVIGVIPEALVQREVAHRGLTELRVVDSMHERKALMAELADAFIALPGGIGTLEELCEVLTWAQLGIHNKPVGLLNVDGYFTPLIAMLDHAVAEGFMKADHRRLLLTAEDAAALLDRCAAWKPIPVRRWLGPAAS
jgi:uncharacterized protein (TIGR00730 family)